MERAGRFSAPKEAIALNDIDDLNAFKSYSVQNAIGCFNEFTNAGPFITRRGKAASCSARFKIPIDRTVRGLP
jgi:hypothetical protein